MSLSRALCRPTFSRTAWRFPLASKRAAAWAPPVWLKRTCDSLARSGVCADYDGDGLADPAVRSESGNERIVMFSSGNYTPVPSTLLFE